MVCTENKNSHASPRKCTAKKTNGHCFIPCTSNHLCKQVLNNAPLKSKQYCAWAWFWTPFAYSPKLLARDSKLSCVTRWTYNKKQLPFRIWTGRCGCTNDKTEQERSPQAQVSSRSSRKILVHLVRKEKIFRFCVQCSTAIGNITYQKLDDDIGTPEVFNKLSRRCMICCKIVVQDTHIEHKFQRIKRFLATQQRTGSKESKCPRTCILNDR